MWEKFNSGKWQENIDVRDFIQVNYKPYDGDASFLKEKTEKTATLWQQAESLIHEEIKKGIIDIETSCFAGIDNFKPGYLDKKNEVIVGFQTDAPLKRIMNPYGGFRMVENSLTAYDYKIDPLMKEHFKEFRKIRYETDDVYEIVKKLDKYSEIGHLYGEELTKMIRFNKLTKYDK